MAKCDVKALGLSLGIVWGALIFLSGICAMLFNWCTKTVEVFSTVYIGYSATLPGSIIGAIWGFVDGGISGVLVGWLYNKFAK